MSHQFCVAIGLPNPGPVIPFEITVRAYHYCHRMFFNLHYNVSIQNCIYCQVSEFESQLLYTTKNLSLTQSASR